MTKPFGAPVVCIELVVQSIITAKVAVGCAGRIMTLRGAIIVAVATASGLLDGIGVAGRAACPNVPSGMLNAANKMSRSGSAASDDHSKKTKKADAMRLTPTHLFHNSTDVVRAMPPLDTVFFLAGDASRFLQLKRSSTRVKRRNECAVT